MKILQLCLKPPLPAKDGGCIAINNITEGLWANGEEVHILSAVTHKHPFEASAFSDEYLAKSQFEHVFIDTRLNLIDAFSCLITQDNYNISRFFSPDFDRALINKLLNNSYDIVHLESLFMTPYIATIRRYTKAKVVLRSHNLEYLIWERLAASANNKAKKTYLKYLAKQLKDYECKVLNLVDGVAAISMIDTKKYHKLGCRKPLRNIPFGINTNAYITSKQSEQEPSAQKAIKTLFHIGAMDWEPNKEGIGWFFQTVWPKVSKEFPELKLLLAGRGMDYYQPMYEQKNITLVGEVEDAKTFMLNNDIMIVPILSAGGIRVKIIEGMALGKTIITTSVGAEGIDVINNKNIIIANSPDDFYQAIKKAVKHPEWSKTIGNKAQSYADEHFNNELICKELIEFYRSLL